MQRRVPVIGKHFDISGNGKLMIRSVNGKYPVNMHLRLTLRRDCSIQAVGTKNNFWITVALQNLSVHLPVAHSASAFATLSIDDDFTGELARSAIES